MEHYTEAQIERINYYVKHYQNLPMAIAAAKFDQDFGLAPLKFITPISRTERLCRALLFISIAIGFAAAIIFG